MPVTQGTLMDRLLSSAAALAAFSFLFATLCLGWYQVFRAIAA